MRVTVLVAAYNAACWLPRCLDSLLTQTYPDVEIIVADDASTDNTQQLLAEHYPQVRVVALPQNMGQAVARNKALQFATGDLVTMVDADDWLSADALQLGVAEFERDSQVDAVLFRLRNVYAKDGSEDEFPCNATDTLSGRDAFRLSLTWKLHGLYIARQSIYRQVPFDTATRLYSDDNTTRLHYLFSRRVAFCNGVYYYYIHSQSCTNHISFSRFHMQAALRSLRRSLVRYGVDEADLRLFEGYRWRMFVDASYILNRYRDMFDKAERQRASRIIASTYRTFSKANVPSEARSLPGFWFLRPWVLMRAQLSIYFRLQALKMKYFH